MPATSPLPLWLTAYVTTTCKTTVCNGLGTRYATGTRQILVRKSEINSSENIWKESDVNEICFMEWAQTTLKLQVRETFSCTIVSEKCCLIFFSSRERTWKVVRDYQSIQSLGLLWSVFDTGLRATPLMGHLGILGKSLECPCDLGFSLGFCCWRKKEQLKLKQYIYPLHSNNPWWDLQFFLAINK